MKLLILIFLFFSTLAAKAAGNLYYEKVNDRFNSAPAEPVLPSKYGIRNNGTLIGKESLYAWLSACKSLQSPVYFPAGTYLLPPDFEFDFGNTDLSITGDGPDKTILTTNNGASTNFAIPEKINLTKQKPTKDGVYQADITASFLHRDFSALQGIALDSYVQIEKGVVRAVTFAAVKTLGYITELDATKADPGIDGLYVVAKHASHDYGGGFKHLALGYTGTPLYIQGTVLQRKDGIWSRFYSSVAFISKGNYSVKNICFSNFRPYLFLADAKKHRLDKKINDHFLIEHCRFEQTARVLATISYGGISDSPNWYKSSTYYPANEGLSFKNFTIRGSEFSYIHESIVWGVPPSRFYNVHNNYIHDCYTILNCFYLFPQYNRLSPKRNKNSFSIYKNTFLRVRALNPGSENSVQLIRTTNKGIISNNIFIDCTGIHLYLNAATKVNNNTIKTYMATVPAAQPRPPLILVKIAKNEWVTFSENNFSMGMMGNLVANESQASFSFTNNKLTGAAVRYITSANAGNLKLDNYRTYTVIDTTAFYKMAGIGNYDTAIRLSNTVYYNKRRSRWEALTILPLMYLYSEVDHFNKNKQIIRFTNNEIETGYLTRIQKKVFTTFHAVIFENNLIQNCTGLHAGNDSTIIESYMFTGNTIKNGSIGMTSLGNVSKAIRTLNVSGNTFYVDFTSSCFLAASGLLILRNNNFIRNNNFNFNDFNSYAIVGITPPVYSLSLSGFKGQQMNISGNRFIAEMTRGCIIQIINPDKVTIANNFFNLIIPSGHASDLLNRQAIYFKTNEPVSLIKIYRNNYLPQANKKNYLVSFDTGYAVIHHFINEGNSVSVNETSVTKTVLATNKYFINYLNRNNMFADRETIMSAPKNSNNPK